jgi:hypothetical protein
MPFPFFGKRNRDNQPQQPQAEQPEPQQKSERGDMNPAGEQVQIEGVEQAAGALVAGGSWGETRAVLEREREALLGDETAIQLLLVALANVQESKGAEWEERSHVLGLYVLLLRDCRATPDLTTGWSRFIRRLWPGGPDGAPPPSANLRLTREAAERATGDANFLAEQVGLDGQDPQRSTGVLARSTTAHTSSISRDLDASGSRAGGHRYRISGHEAGTLS